MDPIYTIVFAWLTVLLVGGIWFRRRDPGRNPGYAAALQFVVPGLGYAYLHRWDRFLAAYLVLIGGWFVLDRLVHLDRRGIGLYAVIGVAVMVFDCMFTARRMAKQERQATGRKQT